MLLLESGVRFHTTKFTHTKSDMPSGFSMKLRKHIRTQRLEDVRQVGMDRVVDFKFGSGKASNHVILELYASGNIILTDSKYEILDLLRTHIYEGQGGGAAGGSGATGGAGDNVRVAVRQIYPMELATTQEGTTAVPQLPPSSSSDRAAAAAAAASSSSVEDSAARYGRVAAPEDQQREEEAPGAFVNGTPLEVGVRRMSEWLERAAAAAAAPPPVLAAPLPPAPPVGAMDAGGDNPAAVAAAAVAAADGANGGGGGGKKKGGGTKKPKKATLKQALMQKGSGVSVYGPSIIEHCVLAAGLRPNAKLTPDGSSGGVHAAAAAAAAGGAGAAACSGNGGELRAGLSEDDVRELVVALGGAEAIVQQLDRPGQRGYIQCKPLPAPAPAPAPAAPAAAAAAGSPVDGERKGAKAAAVAATTATEGGAGRGKEEEGERKVKQGETEEGGDHVVYEEFLPQLLAQHEGGAVIHSFASFDQAVDAFFGRIVEQKLKQTAMAAEAAVERKVAWIRNDQERRVLALEERQEKMLRHAQLAEAWADEVEKALMVVRSALANGMDWQDLEDLVKAETANGNPIASLIHELRLDRNQVVLSLPTAEDGEDDQLVEVDIMLSAHANARVMYENKKLARAKELKTLTASEKVLKIAEQQAERTLQRQAHKRSLQVARKVYWFEKFNWFISSENYLVISGRNAQQNEVVVKKYLRPGDIYVHADLHGASSCVVRNKDPSGKRAVSPLALEEAGCMTVCRSGAWGAKMVTSAWWVYADQVSKTAPTGEYLVTGSFMVRGRKHFLPPRALEMGFALLFKLDDSCLAAHAGERRPARFDAPVGLDGKRGDGTTADDAEGGDIDAANRRAAALAALAGGPGTGGGGGGGGGGSKLTWAATWAPPGGRGERGGGGEAGARLVAAPEAPKKRMSANVPRGKRSKLKRMKKKYAEQDDDDRKLAMEALGKGPPQEDGDTGGGGGRRRFLRPGDRAEAAAAEAAAAAAASKNLRKTEAELAATVAALDADVRGRLSELVKPDELDPFEVRALGKFDTADALDILDRFAEADLRRVRNRSGFLAGIMRKHGSASTAAAESAAPAAAATLPPPPPPPPPPEEEEEEESATSVSASAGEAAEAATTGVSPPAPPTEDEGEEGKRQAAGEASPVEGGDEAPVVAEEEEEEEGAGGGGSDGDEAGSHGGEKAAGEREGDGEQRDAASRTEDQEAGGEEEPLSRRAQKKREEEEVRKLLEEEGAAGEDFDGGGDGGGVSELDRLTGKPRDEDVLLFAVPVCGPYMSLRDYKYKVKLTPGKQKRGKASKQAIEVFSRSRDTPASQKGLMKGITDNECVAAMIGDVKVAVAGLAQATQAKKKANKKIAQRDPQKSAKQPKGKGGKGSKGKK
ncbi:conserved unknown protein [Ectocarpus siliculosus]|uniref:NFACT RNA-binding domain-containing protein n=1 Tax=Ectocarpus siliculosus TaxID=2880 RepID=D8LHP2_ECTSI|nr:conserved unknown protein [Ectocarpus siliculosus]|eukprot:CBN79324.1 conserved unknown protein [Ectocarpus siliculosus]